MKWLNPGAATMFDDIGISIPPQPSTRSRSGYAIPSAYMKADTLLRKRLEGGASYWISMDVFPAYKYTDTGKLLGITAGKNDVSLNYKINSSTVEVTIIYNGQILGVTTSTMRVNMLTKMEIYIKHLKVGGVIKVWFDNVLVFDYAGALNDDFITSFYLPIKDAESTFYFSTIIVQDTGRIGKEYIYRPEIFYKDCERMISSFWGINDYSTHNAATNRMYVHGNAIPCDGLITSFHTSWHAVSSASTVRCYILRKNNPEGDQWDLITTSDSFSQTGMPSGILIAHRFDQPIAVRKGDLIGMRSNALYVPALYAPTATNYTYDVNTKQLTHDDFLYMSGISMIPNDAYEEGALELAKAYKELRTFCFLARNDELTFKISEDLEGKDITSFGVFMDYSNVSDGVSTLDMSVLKDSTGAERVIGTLDVNSAAPSMTITSTNKNPLTNLKFTAEDFKGMTVKVKGVP